MINNLIENHLAYAHAIAADFLGKYPPNITRADLEAAAEFGLVQAARSYDPLKCTSFSTFAYYRVRGAIVDEVRKSWNASHRKVSLEDSSINQSSDGLLRSGGTNSTSQYTPLQEWLPCTDDSPVNQFVKEEEATVIRKAIWRLPKRQRFVLEAHYYHDLSLVSIGKELHLSKSWVSRLHAQALGMVKQILQEPSKPLDFSHSTQRRKGNRGECLQPTSGAGGR